MALVTLVLVTRTTMRMTVRTVALRVLFSAYGGKRNIEPARVVRPSEGCEGLRKDRISDCDFHVTRCGS